MIITARISRFDKAFLPVENPLEFISAARKKLGQPSIRFFRGAKTYCFSHFFGFDYLSIIVDRKERHGYSDE